MEYPALPTGQLLDAVAQGIEGFAELDEPRTPPMSYTLPGELKQRINGLLRFACDTGKLPAINSQIALARVAAHRCLTDLENEHNDGHPFPAPDVVSRKRGTVASGPQIRISVVWPVSLHRRLLGAAAYLAETRAMPGVTSANRLVVAALDRYVTEIEKTHHRGKSFRDPRAKLRGGRPAGR